jgi:hypothetical protein
MELNADSSLTFSPQVSKWEALVSRSIKRMVEDGLRSQRSKRVALRI